MASNIHPDFPFSSVDQIIRANKDAGRYFFSEDSKRFFKSRIDYLVFGGRYFVTSEKYDTSTPRTYSVREVQADGEIDTVGDFQGYTTMRAARKAAESLCADDKSAQHEYTKNGWNWSLHASKRGQFIIVYLTQTGPTISREDGKWFTRDAVNRPSNRVIRRLASKVADGQDFKLVDSGSMVGHPVIYKMV